MGEASDESVVSEDSDSDASVDVAGVTVVDGDVDSDVEEDVKADVEEVDSDVGTNVEDEVETGTAELSRLLVEPVFTKSLL